MHVAEPIEPRTRHLPANSKTGTRRLSRRDPVAVEASVYSRWFDRPIDVSSWDLSPEGMFLQSDLLLERGEKLLISFAVPGTAYMIVVDAEVVRVSGSKGDAGMGIAFANLTDIDDRILRAALDRRRNRFAIPSVSDRAFRA